jgi:YebC/PmpR family DNA-binding regulatory protein
MAGHSRWTQIKRQKGVADARRGQLFTKLAREIMVAVRSGGPDPEVNPRLRLAISRARSENMPMENIERAIKKATGEAAATAALEELFYEGYGPGGAAILVQALTDNRNRTAAEVRHLFERHGGRLGEAGSVSWLFEQRGVIIVPAKGERAEEIALLAIDAGALDVRTEDELVEVQTAPEELEAVRRALAAHAPIQSAELAFIPKSSLPLDESTALKTVRLLEALDNLDDVTQVYCNAEFPNEILEAARSG